MEGADIGVIGLAVMGQNLILNMDDHGFVVACYNRTVAKVDTFLSGLSKDRNVIGCRSIQELVSKLKRPRKILCMVKAGSAVDALMETIVPFLKEGDILIDGGNSHFLDTERREKLLQAKGIFFVGCGISGGEKGARYGPSMMIGGHREAWLQIQPIFQTIAAKSSEGQICADWLGKGGAGHFVKMVHNGIEYGDIQIICESYDLMSRLFFLEEEAMAQIFAAWNKEELQSFLIEITAHILAYKDTDGEPLVRKILDVAGAKGTGKWATESALDESVPLSLIGEAVFARAISLLKKERGEMSQVFKEHQLPFTGDKKEVLDQLKKALYASKIISYTQGYMLMRAASEKYQWDLNYEKISLIWQKGCIIRSRFLKQIREAFSRNGDLPNLLYDPFFKKAILDCLEGWRKIVVLGVTYGIPTPCFSAAIAWFDAIRSESLPVNLLQALRDCFGAHTYERVDQPRNVFFHTDWIR